MNGLVINKGCGHLVGVEDLHSDVITWVKTPNCQVCNGTRWKRSSGLRLKIGDVLDEWELAK